jgi:Outer membrane cobalamin receptor protein
MRHAGFARTLLGSVVFSTALACASNPSQSFADNRYKFGDDLITGDQIDAQHASNAWELLRKMVPRYSYVEDRAGRALSISAHRGRSSIALANSEAPMVIVDGARLSSLELLQDMPTDAIDRIELQGARRGTSSQGTNASAGVIYIHTRSGS